MKTLLLSTTVQRRLRRAFAAAVVLFVFNLFYLGSKPFAVGLVPEPWDKVAHFFAFATLAGLSLFATGGRYALFVLSFALLVGGLDEVHQLWLPGRSADPADFAADLVGALAMVVLTHLMLRSSRLDPARQRAPASREG